jgi:hypothetical protein
LADLSVSALGSQVLVDVYSYWSEKRGDRPYLLWPEVDPVEMPRRALPHLIVAEKLPDGDFFYRLTGTRVDDLIGVVTQGKRLSQLPLDRCEELRGDFQSVIENAEPQVFRFPISTAANRYRETTRVVLPVASTAGRVDMILGAVSYSDPVN